MKKPRIRTSHVNRSPLQDWNWCAWRDGEEKDGLRGWGKTEEEAIDDLKWLEEEEDEHFGTD